VINPALSSPLSAADFQLATIGGEVSVSCDHAGLRFTGPGRLDRRELWPEDARKSLAGFRAAIELEQLLESGLAEADGDVVRIPYQHFADVEDFDIDITSRWTALCPYLLKIDRYSDLGWSDFQYKYEFLRAGKPVFLDRLGYFVRRAGIARVYHLDRQTYSLVEEMDRFNASGPADKSPRAAWLSFSRIKHCANEVGAALDAALQKNDVVVPSAISLSMIEDDRGRLTFVPRCPELNDASFEHAFERNASVEPIYSVPGADGKRLRIVLTERQQEVLQRMKAVRKVEEPRKGQLKSDPGQVFEGVSDLVEWSYSDRVVGVGDFKFAPVPRPAGNDYGMSGLWESTESNLPGRSDGTFSRDPDRPSAESSAGDPIPHDTGSTGGIVTPGEADVGEGEPAVEKNIAAGSSKKYLLIATNEEQVSSELLNSAQKATSAPEALQSFERPVSLLDEVELQPHQSDGVRWLQTCVRVPDRTGVLLADDMGLGKTLQILTFLSWCMEAGRFPDLSRETPPWRPILIVVPLILLDNRTWQGEMEKFFANGGSTFLPVASLHGRTIEKFKRSHEGPEVEIGKPVLDLDRLQAQRVVLTNYDTLKNYQHSLAQFRNGKSLWSVVVTDEAQEYKIPNTKISHAVKALKPDFHIACTGTPVENRLLDLWNVCDAIQPGLLHSARDFTAQYEQRTEGAERSQTLEELKKRLLFQRPHAFLLRRSKSEVSTLPPRHFHRPRCAMSPEEIALHKALIGTLRDRKDRMSHLAVLQRLAQLYQHPVLLRGDAEEIPVDQLLRESTKLRAVCDELHRIRASGQKAIIFARHRVMQAILARVFEAEFRIPVRIINGLTKSTCFTAASSLTRAAILDEFKSSRGFRVIILSPFVAGIGLTITEANHVFHYGRWWNPAVEAQATDRAYRIGQTRDVHVYLPILWDPSGEVSTSFDQRLDRLMSQKTRLAEDFLRPMESEDEIAEQLSSELTGEAGGGATANGLAAEAGLHGIQRAALAACWLERAGYRTALLRSPYGSGIDLFAAAPDLLAVRCSPLPSESDEARAALDQLRAAAEAYSKTVGHAIEPVVWESAPADNSVTRLCGAEGVRRLTKDSFRIEGSGPTRADVEVRAEIRVESVFEAIAWLRRPAAQD
jgi:hypothetical protein